jgi:hypothetical protein
MSERRSVCARTGSGRLRLSDTHRTHSSRSLRQHSNGSEVRHGAAEQTLFLHRPALLASAVGAFGSYFGRIREDFGMGPPPPASASDPPSERSLGGGNPVLASDTTSNFHLSPSPSRSLIRFRPQLTDNPLARAAARKERLIRACATGYHRYCQPAAPVRAPFAVPQADKARIVFVPHN